MRSIPSPQIIRSKRRTLSMHVAPDATLIVKAPMRMPLQEIDSFIQKHIQWIEKKMQTTRQSPVSTVRKYSRGDTFYYLGNIYSLEIGNYPRVAAKEGQLYFPSFLTFRIKKEIDGWYMFEAKNIITRLVEKYAKEMNVIYRSLSFSDTKSRWGSCTHDNHLQFNWRLVMAPMLVIIYVVTHELAHIDEKNHSQDFWRLVRRYNPSYNQSRKWLKDHGDLLFLS